MSTHLWREQRGFTLIDMIAVVMVLGILLAMAAPPMLGSLDRLRLGQVAREVEREIHTARSRAVSKGRAMRMRFNCPAAGQYRMTELIGTTSVPVAADTAANRCDPDLYPFPGADNNVLTRPNLDGPVRSLREDVTFGLQQTIEFWPDGTAHYAGGGAGTPWGLIPVAGINITLARGDHTATITVNGLGKIILATQ